MFWYNMFNTCIFFYIHHSLFIPTQNAPSLKDTFKTPPPSSSVPAQVPVTPYYSMDEEGDTISDLYSEPKTPTSRSGQRTPSAKTPTGVWYHKWQKIWNFNIFCRFVLLSFIVIYKKSQIFGQSFNIMCIFCEIELWMKIYSSSKYNIEYSFFFHLVHAT